MVHGNNLASILVKRIFIVGLIFLAQSASSAEKLYIFFPTTVHAKVVEQKMAQLCSGVEVRVFETYSQLTEKIRVTPPDAIIAKTACFSQLTEFSIVLQAMRDGTPQERYLLLAPEKQLEPSRINTQTKIGILDFLGRTGMTNYAKQFFADPPTLIRVIKIEDLLPLLRFNMAQALVVSKIHADFLIKESNLTLVATPLPDTKSGIAALGVKKGGAAAKSVEAMGKKYAASPLFSEIDQWK